MSIEYFKYDQRTIPVQLPSELHWEYLQSSEQPAAAQEIEIDLEIDLLVSLLKARVKPGAKILLIVPDHTRKCRLHILLPKVTTRLKRELDADIEILIAMGSHVQQPERMVKELVSPEIFEQYPVIQHDSKNERECDYWGKTERGTEIYLNKAIRRADFIITIGAVLYHYFAGYGGGPKMLLPGVASYETIRQNHSLTIDSKKTCFQQECYEGNIATNPVHQDLSTILSIVKNCLSLQLVLLPNGNIYKVKAGPVHETQIALIPYLKELYVLPISEQREVVVASAGGFPADVNLVQMHKSVHHAFQAVKKDGTIIMFAACAEGIGSKTFEPFLGAKDSQEIASRLVRDYLINGHTALILREKTEKARIILISNLDKQTVEQTGMIPADNWQQAWNMVNPAGLYSGYIFPQASLWVPRLSGMT